MSQFSGKYNHIIITVLCVTAAVCFFLSVRSIQKDVSLLPAAKLLKEQKVRVNPTDESDIQNYKRPSSFSIFKFIISFIPGTQR